MMLGFDKACWSDEVIIENARKLIARIEADITRGSISTMPSTTPE